MDMPAGPTELRILLLEDVPTDAELVEIALREAGLSFTAKRVDTREAFIRALEEFKPDIILADYKLPAFDGTSAVRIVRQQHPTVPVVMVTGAMGDERAVELLGLGARDYILKDRLARLGPAVQRALSAEQGIRARKAAEQSLRQSEAELRALVEHSPIAMIVDTGVEPDEKFVMMNRKFTELFGYTMEDVPDTRHWWPLAYPDEKYREELRAEWIKRVEKAIQSHGDIEPMEATVTCKDGSNRYVRASFASIGNRNIITFEDMTERKQAETMLRESEEKFRAIFDGTLDGILLADIKAMRFFAGNPAICRMLGYGSEEITRVGVTDIHPQQDLPYVIEVFEKLKRGEIQLAADIPVKRKDGSVFYADIKGSLVNFGGNTYLVGIFRDITERKQAEEKIRESEAKFRAVVETTSDWLWEISEQGVYTYASPKVHDLLGYMPDEVTGKTPFDLMPTEETARVSAIFNSILAEKRPFQFLENTCLHRDGHAVILETSGVPVFDGNGIFRGYRGIDRDITERRRLEGAFRETANRNQAIMDTASDAIICMKPDGTIHLWNHKAEEMFGYTVAEAVGQKMHELITPEQYRGKEIEGLRKFAETGTGPVVGKPLEITALRKGGTEFPIELTISPMNIRGEWHATGIIRDITERKQAEERIRFSEALLRQTQSVAAIGSWRLYVPRNELIWSDETYRMFGIPVGTPLSYEVFIGHIHPDDRAMVDSA